MISSKPPGWYWVWATSREWPAGRWEVVEVLDGGQVVAIDCAQLDVERWGRQIPAPRAASEDPPERTLRRLEAAAERRAQDLLAGEGDYELFALEIARILADYDRGR